MAVQDILKYIEAHGAQFRIEALVDQLRKAGYPENEIQEALRLKDILVPPPAAQSGFGRKVLIILGIVVAIIAAVWVVILISLNPRPHMTRDPRRISDVKQLQLALELYYDTNGKYPGQLDDLAKVNSCGSNSPCILNMPSDPVTRAPYHYEKKSDCGYYMSAVLEDPSNSALSYDLNPGNSFYEVGEKLDSAGSCPPPRNAPLSSPFGSQVTSATVFSPAKGDKLQRGVTQKIKWNSLPFVLYVKISVNPWIKPCNTLEGLCPVIEYASYTVASKTENDGVFDWTVGKDEGGKYFSDGEYFIMITGFNSSSGGIVAEGVSDRFSIFQVK